MKGYSKKEIQLFERKLLELKENEEKQIQSFNERLLELSENGKEENSIDNTSYIMQLESLINARSRCIKHLKYINNALLRIKNNAYGVCAETGKLIPKDRLLAVPTTTLSIEGKRIRELKKSDRL